MKKNGLKDIKLMENSNVDPGSWVAEYGDYLFNYAIARVHNSAVAEDMVQETFLAAVKAVKSFEGRSTVKTWLTSILKRKIIDHYRKNSRMKEDKVLDDVNFFQKEGILKGHWEDDHLPNMWHKKADQDLETQEFHETLQGCLSKLPERMSAVFTLKEMEEYTTEEICKELDITPSNLWVLIHRAKLRLRECIEKNWFQPDLRI